MIRQIETPSGTVTYTLMRKQVKNINLRIKPDGQVAVSAGPRVAQGVIDDFVRSKAEYILTIREKFRQRPTPHPRFTDEEITTVITAICQKVYPFFEGKGVEYPRLRFQKMVSRWGSCNRAKGILTFSTYLAYAPIDCITYVVLHEFTHFLVGNHSDAFYRELEKVCPEWKQCRKRLREICVPYENGE